jgi:hypothetical protein
VQHAVQTLAKQLQATEKLDAIVIFGDDQHEQFDDRNMPAISIYHVNDVPVSEPNCFACTGIDRGSGFEQIDEAPEYRHRQGPQARRS